jgi:deazaflavin-dependent oxidoreductase (nitroreductase family)
MTKYDKPDWVTQHIFNPLIALPTRLGLSVRGSRVLAVRGRTSGEWRTTPVNLLNYDGGRYLVAPRGNTQWSRNLRAAGGGELRLGSRTEPFTATELADDAKPDLLRAYLKLWSFETGKWFEGVKHDSPDEDVRRIVGDHPVFKIN